MKQNIEIITEFANRESSNNIVGWGSIRSSLSEAVTCFEREMPLRGRWIKSSDTVVCPDCQERNTVKADRFQFYCQGCGRKVLK
jgi:ribosomal protein S27E